MEKSHATSALRVLMKKKKYLLGLAGPQPNNNGEWQERVDKCEEGEAGSGTPHWKILGRRSAVEVGTHCICHILMSDLLLD